MQRDVPIGGIVSFRGAIVDIPARFVLCDGSNGTPDLRDRFIIGASSDETVGLTGGSTTHDHPFTSVPHDHMFPQPVTGLVEVPAYSMTTQTAVATGTTNLGNTLAPYYALCYIMYKGA